MSVSVRISDELGEEIKIIKPSDLSLNKTVETILKLALRSLKNETGDNEESDENFPEKIKRISESMTADFKNQNQDFENETAENEGCIFLNANLDYEKFEERFLKIENMLEKISDAVLKSESSNQDFNNTDCRSDIYTNKVEASERMYNLSKMTYVAPSSLPTDSRAWRAVRWHIDYENEIGYLFKWGVSKLAMFDTQEKKIMVISDEMLEVWYEFDGGLSDMMTECEKRIVQKFYHREPDWFLEGLQYLSSTDRQTLYEKQDIINNERLKKGLKKYASWRC